jgi:hypothetical protein
LEQYRKLEKDRRQLERQMARTKEQERLLEKKREAAEKEQQQATEMLEDDESIKKF